MKADVTDAANFEPADGDVVDARSLAEYHHLRPSLRQSTIELGSLTDRSEARCLFTVEPLQKPFD